MHLARIEVESPAGPEARIAVAADESPDRWIDARTAERLRRRRAGASEAGATRLAAALVPGSLSEALGGGEAFIDAARVATGSSDEAALAPESPRLLAPIDPVARDFMAFEEHFVTAARKLRNAAPAPALYELPVSYFGNPHAIVGPDEAIPWPHYSDRMDCELELGIVIGVTGRDISVEDAPRHVLGPMVFNDFSARDIQGREMSGGLGPSKGKHFGSAVGPRIVTLDSLPDSMRMTARVNGELWSDGSSSTIMRSIAELVAWASASEPLVAGTLLGSGTVGGGCGVELDRQLSPGDVVELEIEGIGVLRNRLGQPPAGGWMLTPKTPSSRSSRVRLTQLVHDESPVSRSA
jgi:2-keto-4-pentenoate hydratase/2-oxohepta-3-ene-1,7-dioic acid hydratase in catechol pathway